MSKNIILITSLISLGLSATYNFVIFTKSTTQILFILTAISWIAVPFVVFSDAKQRGKKPGPWGGISILLGGIGGLIYYATIFKENK